MSNTLSSLAAYVELYIQYMKAMAYSEQTIDYRKMELRYFLCWCEERSINQLSQITHAIIQRYQRHLATTPQKSGKLLSVATQRNRLTAIKMWFKFLMKEHHIHSNPCSEMEMPRLGKQLPKQPLTHEEAELILAQPDIETDLGIRDRAILETFYSTGVRRMELVNLQLSDINVDAGIVAVRAGKGRKDRFIPIGDRALEWVNKYSQDVRPHYEIPSSPQNLFLSNLGLALNKHRLGDRVNRYVRKSGVARNGACHLFRHTAATQMLNNGADIRYIQEMLGHAHLATTEIYTHIAIQKLKDVHTETHPAKLKLPEPTEQDLLEAREAEEAGVIH